jgi:hypothetical protein
VRNIVDQKSAVQTAYIAFMDRFRMTPGDLTVAQAGIVGNGAVDSLNAGDGIVPWGDSVLIFQNLTAAGFISCAPCANVNAGSVAATSNNSPANVYGGFLQMMNSTSAANGTSWFNAGTAVTRLVLDTGGNIPSQVLAEVDRKADDGVPAEGQLRVTVAPVGTVLACAPTITGTTPAAAVWANPSITPCAGAWLF